MDQRGRAVEVRVHGEDDGRGGGDVLAVQLDGHDGVQREHAVHAHGVLQPAIRGERGACSGGVIHLSCGEVLACQLHAVHVHHQALAREHGQLQEGRVACRLHLRAEVHRGQSRGNRPPLAGGTQRPGAVVELGVAPGGGRRERREEEAKRGGVVDEEKVV